MQSAKENFHSSALAALRNTSIRAGDFASHVSSRAGTLHGAIKPVVASAANQVKARTGDLHEALSNSSERVQSVVSSLDKTRKDLYEQYKNMGGNDEVRARLKKLADATVAGITSIAPKMLNIACRVITRLACQGMKKNYALITIPAILIHRFGTNSFNAWRHWMVGKSKINQSKAAILAKHVTSSLAALPPSTLAIIFKHVPKAFIISSVSFLAINEMLGKCKHSFKDDRVRLKVMESFLSGATVADSDCKNMKSGIKDLLG